MQSRTTTDQWGTHGFFFTEAARGGPLTWRAGAVALDGDVLGPVRHAHDDAGEYFFMYEGAACFEVGGREFVVDEGDLLYIPADAPHNVLGPVSGDARMFCVVAPNRADNKWRLNDFRLGSEELRWARANPFEASAPGGGTLSAEGLVLAPGAQASRTPADEECIYIVVSGALDVGIEGGLSGTLEAGSYLHVREGMTHRISAASECRVLRIDCAFAMWEGAPSAADVA